MAGLSLDYSGCSSFMKKIEIRNMILLVEEAENTLKTQLELGGNFTGWVNYPNYYNKDEFSRIKEIAQKISDNADALVVIGIGGSYLGTKAGLDMMTHRFRNQISPERRKGPEIYFIGTSISSDEFRDLMDVLEGKDFYINVISKSGTTIEPAIAFRLLKEELEKRHGKKGAASRIIATTDARKGALRSLAEIKGYETFTIPDDIGGRYSVLTPVGMLPLAVAGLDINSIMAGAQAAWAEYASEDFCSNPCMQYAAIRNILYRYGKVIEVLANFEPRLQYFGEWWKQLFGESEGKDHKGIFPAPVNYTTDLHSLGQLMQDGVRNIFETMLYVESPCRVVPIVKDETNSDGLNYIAGKNLDFVNRQAYMATKKAHVDGGIPVMIVTIPRLDEYYFGYLVYFFERACALSGYVLDVNPFDQPGVEAYKREMQKLLKQ